jgi:hypothetical protein
MSKFVHQELQTKDTDSAKAFYGALFGWTFDDVPMPEGVYSIIVGPEGPFGGIGSLMPGVSPTWMGYVGVDSIDDTTHGVEDGGGRVVVPKTEVPGMGWFAWYEDPQGAAFAVWEAAPQAAAPPTDEGKAKKKAKKSAKKADKKAKRAAKKASKTADKTAKKADRSAKKAAKKADKTAKKAGRAAQKAAAKPKTPTKPAKKAKRKAKKA